MSGNRRRSRNIADEHGNDHDARNDHIGNVKRLAAGADAGGVLGVEEHPADDGAEDPSDAVGRLRQVDARGGISRIAQHGGVRIGDGFQEGQPSGDHADAQPGTPRTRCPRHAPLDTHDVRCRDEPEPAHRHHQQPGDDAALVAQLRPQPAGGHGHEKVAEVVGELHPGRLRLAQAQFVLEVLVHDVDHAVAEPPQEKQRRDEHEGEGDILPFVGDEQAALADSSGFHGFSISSDTVSRPQG